MPGAEILGLLKIIEEVVDLLSASAKIKNISINAHIPKAIRINAGK
jgi:signal transduction histidine kinase